MTRGGPFLQVRGVSSSSAHGWLPARRAIAYRALMPQLRLLAALVALSLVVFVGPDVATTDAQDAAATTRTLTFATLAPPGSSPCTPPA